jgi:hypothetical protein
MGVHEGISRKGKKRDANHTDIGSFFNQTGCCLSKFKKMGCEKWVVSRYLQKARNNKLENLKMRQWVRVNLNC